MNKPFEVCLLPVLLFPIHIGKTKEKVGGKQGLNSDFPSGCPYNHAGQKPQINERNYWKKDWDDQHLHSRWKANSLHHH
jgi:hypothetical protein